MKIVARLKNINFFSKIIELFNALINRKLFLKLDSLVKETNIKFEFLGSSYGGWMVPKNFLSSNSICYSFGLGEDISFDTQIIKKFNLKVFAFDPTPKSIRYIKKYRELPNLFNFYPIGIWSKNIKLKFYAPKNPDHVSHSIINIQNTEKYFEADCKNMSKIMEELNHNKIDLLKMDIEGAEYEVINDILEKNIDIDIILVEFHGNEKKIINFVKKIISKGYYLVKYRNTDIIFIKKNLIE